MRNAPPEPPHQQALAAALALGLRLFVVAPPAGAAPAAVLHPRVPARDAA